MISENGILYITTALCTTFAFSVWALRERRSRHIDIQFKFQKIGDLAIALALVKKYETAV